MSEVPLFAHGHPVHPHNLTAGPPQEVGEASQEGKGFRSELYTPNPTPSSSLLLSSLELSDTNVYEP